jgi:tetratricopeptide (TPR) repeat protein
MRLAQMTLLLGLLAQISLWSGSGASANARTIVSQINTHYGAVCEATLEGWFTKTLKLDWTSRTVRLHVIKIFAEIANVKEALYSDGVRYFKFPNDAGGYNIIDWQTGEKTSVSERAPYYFDAAPAASTMIPTAPDQPTVILPPGRPDGSASSNSNSPYLAGLASLERGDYEQAIADFTAAIEGDSADVMFSYMKRATAYEKKGDRDSAVADYRKALTLTRDGETRRGINAAIKRLTTAK